MISAIDYIAKETASRVTLLNPTITDIFNINQNGASGSLLYLNKDNPAKVTEYYNLNKGSLDDFSVAACENKDYESKN